MFKFNKDKKIIFHKSDVGFVRSKNEDYSWSGTNSIMDHLLIVSDGVGSYGGSHIASRVVAEVFSKSFLDKEYLGMKIKLWFEKNIRRIKSIMNEHIKTHPFHYHMATTLVLAIVIKKDVHIFWIGDSRAYLINKKAANLITEDHNLLNHLIGMKASESEIYKYGKYLSSITNSISCISDSKQKYDYEHITLKTNTFIFLASDGFYNFYELNNLYDIISNDTNKDIICDELISNAITNGSNDNISFSYFGIVKNNY